MFTNFNHEVTMFSLFIPGAQNTNTVVFRNMQSKVRLQERRLESSVAAPSRGQIVATCKKAEWIVLGVGKKCFFDHPFFGTMNNLLSLRKKQQELDF